MVDYIAVIVNIIYRFVSAHTHYFPLLSGCIFTCDAGGPCVAALKCLPGEGQAISLPGRLA